MQINTISLFVLLCGLTSVIIAVYAWNRRSINGALWFSLFMMAESTYIIGYSFELSSLDLEGMLFWSKVQYFGILSFPTFFLIFTLQYTHQIERLTSRSLIFFFIAPVVLLFVKLFDDRFHLFYQTAQVYLSGQTPLLSFTEGPVYLLSASYNMIVVGFGNFFLWKRRRFSSSLYKKQSSIILMASILLYLVYLVYLSGYHPFAFLQHVDINPFSYTIWSLAIGWAIFRYRLFDLVPYAREKLIETLPEGVLVFDNYFRLVDANPASKGIFGWDQVPNGWNVSKVFADWRCSAEGNETIREEMFHNPGSFEISCLNQADVVCYDITITDLQERKGEVGGRLIVMHNITSRKQIEEELNELSLEDELTGLKNRRGFFTLANQMIRMVDRMGLTAVLVYVDLDVLKSINDTMGHPAGDRAILTMAQSLQKTCRASDIIARLGGDEFVILAIGSEADLADVMVERLEEQLQLLENDNQMPYKLSFSYGLATCQPNHLCLLENLIDEADRAMYEQKQLKRQSIMH